MPTESRQHDLPAILGGPAIRPDGPPDWPMDDPAVQAALQHAIDHRMWGKYHSTACDQLSERLAAYLGTENVMLCSSGTVAIELALRGLGIKAGDEVILAAYDFKGNFQDVLAVGAIPVLVDVDPYNWNMDPKQLDVGVTDQTAAIIISHLHGGFVPMYDAYHVIDRHGIPVIEDACQVPGGNIHGCRAGTNGDVGVFSFGGSKLMTSGRGGCLFGDAAIIQRARIYANRGNDAYPLSEFQAAILVPQLEQLDERNITRDANAQFLCRELRQRDGLVPFQNREVADMPYGSQPVFYKVGFQYEPAAFDGLSRDVFARAMRAEGIALDPGFRSLHKIHGRRRFRSVGELPNATDADERVLTLHHPILLGTHDDMRQILDAVEKIRRYAKIIRQKLDLA